MEVPVNTSIKVAFGALLMAYLEYHHSPCELLEPFMNDVPFLMVSHIFFQNNAHCCQVGSNASKDVCPSKINIGILQVWTPSVPSDIKMFHSYLSPPPAFLAFVAS